MPDTSVLHLKLTTDDSTVFKTWREGLDGEGSGDNKSNMQKIDDWAATVEQRIGNVASALEQLDTGSGV